MNNTENDRPVITEPVHDLYLRMLIKALEYDESHQSSMTITLMVNGGVVYGHLITKESWKLRWAEQMKSATGIGMDVLRTFPDSVDKALAQALDETEGQGDEQGADDWLRYFVHLKDATMLVPGGERLTFPAWRGRLDSVAGWSIGMPGD